MGTQFVASIAPSGFSPAFLPGQVVLFKKRKVTVIESSVVPDGLYMIADDGGNPTETESANRFSVREHSMKALATPRSLRIQALKPEWTPFIIYLGTPEANTLLTLEAQCPEMDFAVRQQYRKLTGGELSEGAGYNVAPPTAGKQGCEGSVTFKVPAEMPQEIKDLMVQRPGLINRIDFVWMLVEHGFRVTR